MEGEYAGEGGIRHFVEKEPSPHFILDEIIQEKKLTLEEAGNCLSILGKDESGVRYAYLMLNISEMKLTDISVITNFNHLFFVDLSGNLLNLDGLQIVAEIPFLLYLRAERNRLESAALKPIPFLQVLILNKNSITETGDIHQPMVESLELSENLIYTIQFDPERLDAVKEVILYGNHLLDTSGTYPKNIEKLFLGKNKITKINTDFYEITKLQYLHLRDNNIKKLNGFIPELEKLTYINLRSNKISKMREFRKLAVLPNLETLIMLDNPVYKDKEIIDKGEASTARGDITEEEEEKTEIYGEGGSPPPTDIIRVRLLALLPNLKRINKEVVSLDEREVAEMHKQRLIDEIFAEESSEEETELPTTTTAFTSEYTSDTEPELGHPVSEESGREEYTLQFDPGTKEN